MRALDSIRAGRLLGLLAGALVVKVTASVVSRYVDYFPPDFGAEFLRGRDGDFLGVYPWAFYTHILAGPVSLILGLFLISARARGRFPGWHRRLGRVQAGCVLGLVAPSGLWMAFSSRSGPLGVAGLAALAMGTALCCALGVRSAMARRYTDHRRWMWRCFLLLCSAVVLRMIGGLATVAGITADWIDPVAIWVGWGLPLLGFEVWERMRRRGRPYGVTRGREVRPGYSVMN